MCMARTLLQVVEMNLVPTFVLRMGIRYLLRTKCLFHFTNTEDELQAEVDFVKDLRTRAVAEQTKAANEQHYEVWGRAVHVDTQ